MKDPASLSRGELVQIVSDVRDALYLETDEQYDREIGLVKKGKK